jgi:plastocyanin
MKIDAVPGLISRITLVPTEEGDYSTNPMLRLQCTELCGLSHSRMQIPVRVVSEAEFDAWLAENQEEAAPSPSDGESEVLTLEITARDLLFDTDTLDAVAGEPFDVLLKNDDAGVPHNVSVYTDSSAAEAIFEGEIIAGVDTVTYRLPGLDGGSYFFRCDVHPQTMTGTLELK